MTPDRSLLCDQSDDDTGNVSFASTEGGIANGAGSDRQKVAVANVGGHTVQAPASEKNVGRTEAEGRLLRRLTGDTLVHLQAVVEKLAGVESVALLARCMEFKARAVPFGCPDAFVFFEVVESHSKRLVIDATGTPDRARIYRRVIPIPVMDGFFLPLAAPPLDTDIATEPLTDPDRNLNEALERSQAGGASSPHRTNISKVWQGAGGE